MEKKIKGFSWKNRRRAVWCIILFCMALITYLAIAEVNTVARGQLSIAIPILLSSTIACYCFGAVIENVKGGNK